MKLIFESTFYLANAIVLPLLLAGFIGKVKARLQNRTGPPLLQPWWVIAKLMRKGETVSDTATWAFRLGPFVSLGSVLAVALMTPWIGTEAPMPGDLFLVVYLLCLGKFCMSLAALDTGGPFAALGASREAAISIQSEPAMVLALAALAWRAHSSSLVILLAPGGPGAHTAFPVALAVVALSLAAIAELARMPIDDPATHLELTMVHEAMILENSGRNLAIVEYTIALKTGVLLGLIAQVILIMLPRQSPVVAYAASAGLIGLAGAAIAVAESALVKLRWRRVPNLMSFAVGASVLACLLVALGL